MSEDAADEPGIPRAALNKLVKEALPQIRIANDTRDMLHACCLEFIEHIGSEANRICAQELKKTITHEHVLKSLQSLGFGADYLEAVQSVLGECQQEAQRRQRRQSSRLDKCGIPEDELLKQQQELFDKARAAQAESENVQITWFQQLLSERLRRERDNAQNLSQGENANASDVGDGGLPLTNVSLVVRCSNVNMTEEDYDAV